MSCEICEDLDFCPLGDQCPDARLAELLEKAGVI